MSTSLRVGHLGRYARIASLLVKHGRSGARPLDAGLDLPDEGDEPATAEDAHALVEELVSMGPTFIKLGQVLSTRADLLPPVYLDALAGLREHVEPFAFEEVERIVETELGVRISQGFRSFDHDPLASASLGQVHRAVLRDGRSVAVKVQRPGIRERVLDDMSVIEELAGFAADHTRTGRRMGFRALAREFRASTMAELDYRQEAANLRVMARQLEDLDLITVPLPIDDYTTDTVLTMELVAGRSVATLTPVGRTDIDGTALAEELFRAYLDQILVHGFVHADPHPGNVLLTDDGQLALIDLGMVAHLDEPMQDGVVRLLAALSDGDGPKVADVLREVSTPLEGYDEARFSEQITQLVTTYRAVSVGDLDAGRVVGEMAAAAMESGLRPPTTLTMVGKALLNLDMVVRTLDPELEPDVLIERHVTSIVRRRMLRGASPGSLLAAAMEGKEFAERLPGRVNKVMDALSEGQLTLNIRGIDEAELMRSVQKLANRLTAGLVVAALIIGAAMLMRIETEWTILGYPGIAISLFMVASLLGLWLVVGALLSDLPQRRRGRRHEVAERTSTGGV